MGEQLVTHLAELEQYATVWGYLAIFALMAIESSFIPFPSEVVMIPAGFLAARGALSCGTPWLDGVLAVLVGLLGSMAGAYVNYFLALKLGEPFLRKYGKYFFIKPETLDRASEIFRRYGDLATFVCRLLPAIRQLISIPAVIAKMPLGSFTLFTALGAGLWTAVLAGTGFWLGRTAGDITYGELVHRGKDFIDANIVWLIAAVVLAVAAHFAVSKVVMGKRGNK